MNNQRFIVPIICLTTMILISTACGTSTTSVVPTATDTPNLSSATPTPEPTNTSDPSETPSAISPSTSPLSVTKTESVVYARRTQPPERELLLDEYAPTEPGDWPIVLFVHGLGGERGRHQKLMETLAEKGVMVFDIAYRDMPFSMAVEGDSRGYREMTETVACALRFVHARALELGNDRPFITFVGFSLGAGIGSYLALVEDNVESRWEAYTAAKGGPLSQTECEADESVQVDALVGIGSGYDIFIGSDGKLGDEALLKAQNIDLWEMFHSAIGENPDLKVRLLIGKLDFNYDANEVSVVLEAILAEAGYDVELIQFSGGHEIPFELTVQTVADVIKE